MHDLGRATLQQLHDALDECVRVHEHHVLHVACLAREGITHVEEPREEREEGQGFHLRGHELHVEIAIEIGVCALFPRRREIHHREDQRDEVRDLALHLRLVDLVEQHDQDRQFRQHFQALHPARHEGVLQPGERGEGGRTTTALPSACFCSVWIGLTQ